MIETPIVAISGNSSLPLRRSGAKIAALTSQPSTAPTTSATPMLDEVTAAEQMHEEIGGEGAERDEIRVREIDLDQHAVDQREAQRHQHIEASENDAVDRLLERRSSRSSARSVPLQRLP